MEAALCFSVADWPGGIMRRVIISKDGSVLAGSRFSGFSAPSHAALTVQTVEAFQERRPENRTERGIRSSHTIIASKAIYGRPVSATAKARAEKRQAREAEVEAARQTNLAWARNTPILSEAEALELVRKHRELEAKLLAEERAEEQAEARAKREAFVARRRSALAGLNTKTG